MDNERINVSYFVECGNKIFKVNSNMGAERTKAYVENKFHSKVVKIVPTSGYHICKYCGSITRGSNEDALCKDCRELFGHSMFSQL